MHVVIESFMTAMITLWYRVDYKTHSCVSIILYTHDTYMYRWFNAMGLYRYYPIKWNRAPLASACVNFDYSPIDKTHHRWSNVIWGSHGKSRMALNFSRGYNGAKNSVIEIDRNDKQEVSVIWKMKNCVRMRTHLKSVKKKKKLWPPIPACKWAF